jgi:excisionase family DNA binding protein
VDDNSFVTVNEAARLLKRSTEQVRRYLREGRLPGRRIGGQWFIEREAVTGYPRQSKPNVVRVAEAAAVYETEASMLEKIIARINHNREAIQARIGGNVPIDVVEALREDREAH